MLKTISAAVVLFAATLAAQAQSSQVSFYPATKVFRLDGGGVSYAFREALRRCVIL
jgi:hypothetical protein